MFEFALQYVGPVYIRMDNAKFPALHSEDYQFVPGKASVMRQGDDMTIFALGSVVHEAYEAAHELEKVSIDAEVVNVSSIRPFDRDKIIESVRRTGKVVTVEEHSLHGGLGTLICEIIAEENLNTEIVRLGIAEGRFAKAGPRAEIRAYYKIDKDGITEAARTLMT
jgi:transketolase